MTQLRIDPISGVEVVMAAERSARPSDLKTTHSIEINSNQPRVTNCPFCPGNESRTPPEIDTLVRNGHWVTRTFANKFPIFKTDSPLQELNRGFFLGYQLPGVHHVIVDHPDHQMNFFRMGVQEMDDLLCTYEIRYQALQRNLSLTSILIFKNYLKGAGASLEHPHTQMIGTVFVPPQLKKELAAFQKYEQEKGQCIFCHLLQEEEGGVRQVFTTDHFLVLIPYAARFPYETWILPRKHRRDFGFKDQKERYDLAVLLKELFFRYYRLLGDFPFNMYFHSYPGNGDGDQDFHWHIEIAPRISNLAGFELGGGIWVNTVLPEAGAKLLSRGDLSE